MVMVVNLNVVVCRWRLMYNCRPLVNLPDNMVMFLHPNRVMMVMFLQGYRVMMMVMVMLLHYHLSLVLYHDRTVRCYFTVVRTKLGNCHHCFTSGPGVAGMAATAGLVVDTGTPAVHTGGHPAHVSLKNDLLDICRSNEMFCSTNSFGAD